MYATNDNQQAVESRNRITEALLTLMRQYAYKDITITQICQEAQVVRQTYYRNFDTKDDILQYYLDNMLQQYLTKSYQPADIHAQMKNFFEYMLHRSEFLTLALKNGLFFMLDKTISENLTHFLNFQQLTSIVEPNLEKYVTGFIASTICSLLFLWADSGFVEPPERMSQLAQKFLGGLGSKER